VRISRYAADASEGGREMRETIRGVAMVGLWAIMGGRSTEIIIEGDVS
jgi:hypothetical protein